MAHVSGSGDADTLVSIYDANDVLLGTTTANGNGDWSFTPTTPLPDGSVIEARQTDSVGNQGSSTQAIAIDTDGDNVANSSDLDDNNNGILDTHEVLETQVLQDTDQDMHVYTNSGQYMGPAQVEFTPTVTGSYRIDLTSSEITASDGDADDLSRSGTVLRIGSTSGGTDVLDETVLQSVSEGGQTQTIELTAGQTYYFEYGGRDGSIVYGPQLDVTHLDFDVDGDGVENRLDLDSDGGGIYDIVENGGVDADNDGMIDPLASGSVDGQSLDGYSVVDQTVYEGYEFNDTYGDVNHLSGGQFPFAGHR